MVTDKSVHERPPPLSLTLDVHEHGGEDVLVHLRLVEHVVQQPILRGYLYTIPHHSLSRLLQLVCYIVRHRLEYTSFYTQVKPRVERVRVCGRGQDLRALPVLYVFVQLPPVGGLRDRLAGGGGFFELFSALHPLLEIHQRRRGAGTSTLHTPQLNLTLPSV